MFRSEVDATRDYLSTEFYLEVDLYWGDVDPSNAYEIKEQMKKYEQDDTLFKRVGQKTFRVKSMVEGLNEYFPILFTRETAGVFNCVLHSTILEFKS